MGTPELLRLLPILFCISALTACAGPEKTFRDAHDVVTEVIDLTVEAENPSDANDLYALEERVEVACRSMFKSAHRQWVFGEVPIYTQLETLVSTHRCRQTVDEARRLLDAYLLERGTPAPAIAPKGSAIY